MCPNLSEIRGRDISSGGLRALGMFYTSTLTVVDFGRVGTSNSDIERLCKGCPALKTLKLLIKSSSSDGLTDDSVSSISRYCPNIECLSLEGWKSITDASLISLTALTSLRELNLSGCVLLTSDGVPSLVRGIGATLEVIILSNVFAVTTDACSFCDDALLLCIGENCPKLRRFAVSIKADSNVTDTSFVALVRGCPLLQDLSLCFKKVTDTFLIQLADQCPDLQKLSCRYGNYTDAGVVAVASKCTKLECLTLILSVGDELTDTGIVGIAKHCKCLKVLCLIRLMSITDTAFRLLFELCSNLTVVSLMDLPLITDRSLLTLVRCNAGLRSLTLIRNTKLTEKTLASLITLHGLEDLCINDCPTLSDDTVCLLARLCSKFDKVKVSHCPLVTTRGLTELLTHSKKLTSLTIQECGIELSALYKVTHLAKRSSSRRLKVSLDTLGDYVL